VSKSKPDQLEQEISAFLQSQDAWGRDGAEIEMIETHVSRVFLNGTRVFKMKRHVRFPYLDFSSLDQRKQACDAEFAINRRTAPDIYKGVQPVTRDQDGKLYVDGPGSVVDWLVEMVQFDQTTLFDRMAKNKQLDRHLMEKTAEVIALFHKEVTVVRGRGGQAGSSLIARNNNQSFAEVSDDILAFEQIDRLQILTDRILEDDGEILDSRRDIGLVRQAHGDMHLRNICLFEGKPTLFDAIEFNDDFAHIDILYDLAFLLMDLDCFGLRSLANCVLNRYFDVSGGAMSDPENFKVLPLFLSMRAAVRSHVDAAQARSLDDPALRDERAQDARNYLEMAVSYLQLTRPRLIAIGGLSGSGKSTLARDLAPEIGNAPGARIVRTDVTRKRLCGCPLDEKLGEDGYTPEMNAQTYEAFYSEIQKCLNEGQSVIADAVFARPGERERVAEIARETDVAFQGLWIDVSEQIMIERVTARLNDASDADAEIVRQQQAYELGPMIWDRIDGSGMAEQTLQGAQLKTGEQKKT